jgi:hypothetical protein
MRIREIGTEPGAIERRLPGREEQGVVCHEREQAIEIAGVDCTDPGRMQCAYLSFIGFHVPPA